MSPWETPLIHKHVELGASLGEFAGWRMPIFYSSVTREHMAVREGVGVFDLSHMARILIRGEGSVPLLEKLVAKRVANKPVGSMIGPTAFLNEEGGFKDDIMLYRMGPAEFLVVGNAVNREKDRTWLEEHAEGGDVKVRDLTEETAMVAVQGPRARALIRRSLGFDLVSLKPLSFAANLELRGVKVLLISRSGWTGEEGAEIIGPPSEVVKAWELLTGHGGTPCGLGARDSLRIEMGYCLYGSEINEEVTPLEARYKVYSLRKEGYIGKEALWRKYIEGVKKARMGLVLKGRGPIPRRGARLYAGGNEVGHVTSGTYSPTLGYPVAQAYVSVSHLLPGLELEVEVRGKRYKCMLEDFPFITLRW